MERRGGDPEGLEYSASRIDVRGEAQMRESLGQEYIAIRNDERWLVHAKGIHNNASGAKRSVPGGFTDYFLSADGKILNVRQGR